MDMTINYSIQTTDNLVACDSAIWNGNTYFTSGILVDTLQTIGGCDSVVTTDLLINYSTTNTDSLVSCDSAIWNGNLYTKTGKYIDTLQTVNGCDSIVTMDVTINNSIATNDTIFACDSAEWNGSRYSISGTYIDTLQTIYGCDSIVTMDMTINYSTQTTDNLVACDSAIWNGNVYITSGIFIDTLQTIHGCDSIILNEITINNSITTFDVQSSCDDYVWNGNTYNSSGTYIDTLSTIHGCDSIVYLNLNLYTTSQVSAGIDTSICFGESITLNAVGNGTLSWNNGVTNGQSFVVDSSRVYLVELINSYGCITNDSITITVLNLPNVDAGSDNIICIEDSVQLIASGAMTYNWMSSSILLYDSIYVSPVTTTRFYLTGVDSNGCINSDSMTISVNNLPNITIDTILPICLGDSITLNASGGILHLWSGGINNNTSFVPDSSQTFTVNVTDSNGCENIDSVQINVNSLPTVFAGIDTSICYLDTISLNASGNNTSYSWNNGVINGVLFSPDSSSEYVVSTIDSNSCFNTDTINVEVIVIPVDAGSDSELCYGDSISLNGVGPNPIWSQGIINGNTFFPDSSMEYILTVSDSNGCFRYDTLNIIVNSLPNVIAPEDTVVCNGDEIQLFGSGAEAYEWNYGFFNGELFSPEISGNYIVIGTDSNRCENIDSMFIEIMENPVINYTVSPVIYGNDANIMLNITGGNPWKDCGIAEFEQPGPCQEPYLYDWDIDGLGDMDDDLHLFYLNPGNYFITVYDSLTCRDTATITIENSFEIFVPSAITPNNDGYNDTWDIRGINNFPTATILVFDIQGQVVYQHNNADGDYQPWNARYLNGELIISADYYYQIILDSDNPNLNNTKTGSIIIVY
jgi:gliding motility-associated-like protein